MTHRTPTKRAVKTRKRLRTTVRGGLRRRAAARPKRALKARLRVRGAITNVKTLRRARTRTKSALRKMKKFFTGKRVDFASAVRKALRKK